MEMPKVMECDVTECAYNLGDACHAMAITIGDSVHPGCDTFCMSDMKGGDPSCTGSVGACKMTDCMYNSMLECEASGIKVGHYGDEVDCLTFKSA